jgi:signal transduction histidine kinase/BarA-like signal transduction histidine kinase
MSSELKANILLIDDHVENLIALEAILGGLGENLVKAHSGKEALRCLLKQDFAVILLDVQMPDMDGFETASLIRQRERSQYTPIIFITAFNTNDRWQMKGYALGAVDYLLKPIEPEILVSKVSVFVELFKNAQEIQRQSAELAMQKIEIMREQLARQQAEAASRMKDEFLAIVSHELRTPLNSILGWSKLLAADKLDPEKARRAIETISRNAQAQAQLIDDILDVARLMRGKLRLNLQPVDLFNLISAELDSIRPSADAKEIRLVGHLTSDPCIIKGDVQRLQQILRNLLSNAIKFTPEGGQVEVSLATDETDNLSASSVAQITITDTGVGIDPDFLPHIFEYFQQADSSSTRSHDGLGLGLAIVHQLVALHGGKIYATSEGAGKGATFTIHLPSQVSSPQPLPEQSISPNAANNELLLDGISLLVVDDNSDNRSYVVTVLEQAGAQVTAVASGQEAMDYLQHSQPDVLLTDLAMPEEDGYELLQRVQRFEHDRGVTIPAIALTAYAQETDRMQALAAGFRHFLAKPLDPTELIQAVAEVVSLPSNQSEKLKDADPSRAKALLLNDGMNSSPKE